MNTSISQIIGSIPEASQAYYVIQQGQTSVDAIVFNQSNAAAQYLSQLNQHQISGAEFQDLMQDLKNQVDANSAAQDAQFQQMLSNSIGLMIFVSRQYAL